MAPRPVSLRTSAKHSNNVWVVYVSMPPVVTASCNPAKPVMTETQRMTTNARLDANPRGCGDAPAAKAKTATMATKWTEIVAETTVSWRRVETASYDWI